MDKQMVIKKAAERFLYRRGYEIVTSSTRSDSVVVIAEDCDCTIVICSVIQKGSAPWSRNDFERELELLVENKTVTPDHIIRFDELVIDIVAPDAATIRHHINCMSTANVDEIDLSNFDITDLNKLICRAEETKKLLINEEVNGE